MDAVLADWRNARVSDKVGAALAFVEKVTVAPETVGKDDVTPLRGLGVPRQGVEDALLVCFCFNIIDRLADAFGWHVPGRDGFDASAKLLLSKGYLMPFHRVEG